MEKKFIELQTIETKANLLANKALDTNRYMEVCENPNSHLNKALKRWQSLMEDLRGWSDYQVDSQTKETWMEYCTKNNLDPFYKFGDVTA